MPTVAAGQTPTARTALASRATAACRLVEHPEFVVRGSERHYVGWRIDRNRGRGTGAKVAMTLDAKCSPEGTTPSGSPPPFGLEREP